MKKTGLAVSDWRNIEIKRAEGTEQINQAFLRDSPDSGGNSPTPAREMREKLASPVMEESRTKLASPPTLAENTNKVPAGIIFTFFLYICGVQV